MYDLTDPTTRATVQEIRRATIAEAARHMDLFLRRNGWAIADIDALVSVLTDLADNPPKP